VVVADGSVTQQALTSGELEKLATVRKMFINDNTSKERVEIAAIEMRVRKRGEL
jgi:hypothetical protein